MIQIPSMTPTAPQSCPSRPGPAPAKGRGLSLLPFLAALLVSLVIQLPARAQLITRPIPVTSDQEDLILIRFFTGGKTDRTGRGIAILDADKQGVPYRILAHDPDGETFLAVDVRTAPRPIRLVYGSSPNAQAKQDDSLNPSLILQTFPLPRRDIKNPAELAALFTQGRPLGTAVTGSIFFGHNPFGPGTDFATLVQGQLTIDSSGDYWLVGIHDDAAFIEIDGKVVYGRATANAGFDSERVGRQAVKVTLDEGTHPFRFMHAQYDGGTTAVFGLRSSEDERIISPVPSGWYVIHPSVELGLVDTTAPNADRNPVGLDAHQVDQIAHEAFTFTRIRFQPIATPPAGARYRIEFSDGTSYTTPASDGSTPPAPIDHIYLSSPADWPTFRASIEMLPPGNNPKGVGLTNIAIRMNLFTSTSTIGDRGLMAEYARAIGAADYANAKPELYAALYILMDALDQPELTAPLAESFISRFGDRRGALVDQMKESLAIYVSASNPARAAQLFEELSTTAASPWLSAIASAEQLDLMIFRLNRAKEVPPLVAKLSAGKTARERALLQARLGDSLRVAGKLDEAEKVYRDAQPDTLRKLEANKAAVQERAYREKAIWLFDQHRYPELRLTLLEWEADFPIAKLGGDLPLIRGRYFQATGDDARAQAELRTILELNPMHPSKPEIMFRLAQSLMRLGKTDEATAMFDKVASDYPNSPFANRARARDVDR